MIAKEQLVNRVVQTLDASGFNSFLFGGCFDVLAKNDRLLTIKALTNVDAFSKENADNLKVISHFFSANALMISVRSNHGKLEKNVIYSRFDVPTMTPELFESFVENEWLPSIFAIKGKHTVEIDAKLLKQKRHDKGLTLDVLSRKIGISKKSLYEIENERVNPTLETVKALEEFFQINLVRAYEFEPVEMGRAIRPKTLLERKVSTKFDEFQIEHSCLTSLPFEIIAKKRKPILTALSQDDTHVESKTKALNNLSSFVDVFDLFVLRKSRKENIEGIPVVLDSEIDELENYKEFYRLIKERS